MRAVLCTRYGPPDVLQLREVNKPAPRRDEVRVRIAATAVTSSDCIVRGFKVNRHASQNDLRGGGSHPLRRPARALVPEKGKDRGSEAAGQSVLAPDGKYVSVLQGRPRFKLGDLALLGELVAAGQLRPVIDRTYPLVELAEAHRYVDAGHKKGNVVVRVA